jgi:glutamyl-tRNA reductase
MIALVAHARQVPASEREPLAAWLRAELGDRAVLLETCHRVEAYASGVTEAETAGWAGRMPAGVRLLAGDAAARHAVAVAVGRDSVVLGEDQILHQLRTAVDAARTAGALDAALERLFSLALHAGRRARSWHVGRRRSLADVAVDAIERTSGSLRARDVLVVGAGRMGDLAARAAAAAGATVHVANRSVERAASVAAAVGGQVADLDPGPAVTRFPAVVIALGGPWSIAPETALALARGGAIVVDLSVPAAVPADLAAALVARLVTADDLARAVADVASDAAPGAPASDPRTDALIDEAVRDFADWQARGDARAAADALVRRADREREAELAALWRRLPTLEPEVRDAIEGMTRHLAARLLRQPLARLGRDAEGADGRAVRDLFAL